MARNEAPPFSRGETIYNGNPIDVNDLGGGNLEGKEYVFEVNPPIATGTLNTYDPSGRPVVCRCVRNRSGVNLKGARLAAYAVGSANANLPIGTGVAGYTFSDTDQVAGVIDEFLPPAGVPPNDLFWLVIDGPTRVTTPASGTISIAAGAKLAPATGTSATNDDAGRANVAAGTPSVAQAGALIGRSDSTTTVATTSASFPAVVRHLNR